MLFRKKGDLSTFLEGRRVSLRREVEGYERDYILKVSEEDLCQYLTSKYSLEPPTMRESEIYVYDQSETDIDVRMIPGRFIVNRSRPHYVRGVSVTIAVPFDGDEILFHYRPSTFTAAPPSGETEKQEVHLIYEMVEHDAEKLKKMYNHDLNEISRYLVWVRQEAKGFNDSLTSFVRQTVSQRRKKLLDDLGLVGALGIPVKRRDIPQTYTIPSIRKKPRIQPPKVAKEPFEPEPVLSVEEYENILEMSQNMALVMERSPKTFSKLREEGIRDHFLMMLNANYEGQATGETFNYGGKTDILIRVEGKNVFISECKFWRGQSELLKSIDQLFRYSSWRDTKTAILLFNRNQNFSDVIKKIDPTAKSHKCYKREWHPTSEKLNDETIFGFLFHQPRDVNREVILTVMAFDIPTRLRS